MSGYYFVGFCRFQKAVSVISSHWGNEEQLKSSLTELWILLHTASLVRLVLYHVTPYTSIDGKRRGDLITDPLVYTLGVSLATLVTLSYVYPPELLMVLLLLVSVIELINPSKIRSRPIPLEDDKRLFHEHTQHRSARRSRSKNRTRMERGK